MTVSCSRSSGIHTSLLLDRRTRKQSTDLMPKLGPKNDRRKSVFELFSGTGLPRSKMTCFMDQVVNDLRFWFSQQSVFDVSKNMIVQRFVTDSTPIGFFGID